jgi:hypothetical protein
MAEKVMYIWKQQGMNDCSRKMTYSAMGKAPQDGEGKASKREDQKHRIHKT